MPVFATPPGSARVAFASPDSLSQNCPGQVRNPQALTATEPDRCDPSVRRLASRYQCEILFTRPSDDLRHTKCGKAVRPIFGRHVAPFGGVALLGGHIEEPWRPGRGPGLLTDYEHIIKIIAHNTVLGGRLAFGCEADPPTARQDRHRDPAEGEEREANDRDQPDPATVDEGGSSNQTRARRSSSGCSSRWRPNGSPQMGLRLVSDPESSARARHTGRWFR